MIFCVCSAVTVLCGCVVIRCYGTRLRITVAKIAIPAMVAIVMVMIIVVMGVVVKVFVKVFVIVVVLVAVVMLLLLWFIMFYYIDTEHLIEIVLSNQLNNFHLSLAIITKLFPEWFSN